MSSWEVLVQNADANVQDGNLKSAYAGYLKAASLLLNKLATEPSAKDAKTKSNSIRSFQNLKTCIQHAEDILANRVKNGTLPSPQSSFNDVIPFHSPSSNLPLVPFSPLTRQSLMTVSAIATLANKVAVTRQTTADLNGNSEHTPNKESRKLMDDLHVQKSKLDSINMHIQTISTKSLIHWDVDTIAKQLTIIESQLFKKVDVRKDFLSKDKKRSSIQACLDFHRYLTNSFTHQIIIFADTVRSGQNTGRSQQNDNIIARGIKIAYLLLHVYRNFNSFAAIVKALNAPEVRRLRRLWINLNTRTSQILKDLVVYINPANEYKAYKDMLIQKIDSYRDLDSGMIAIPWMLPHYEEIKSVSQSYGDSSIEALGARKRSFIFSLLEQCQSNTVSADDDEWSNARKLCSSGARAKDTIVVDGTLMVSPPDLSCLGAGELGLYHWLVSRVYLTKRQLVDESLVIEPLNAGEPVLRVDEDELFDYNSDQVSVEHDDSGSDSGDAIDQKSPFQFPGRISVSKTTERSNENRSLLELQLSDSISLLSSLEPYGIPGESSTDGNGDNNRSNETTKGMNADNSSTATGSPFNLSSLEKTQTKTTVNSYTSSTSTPAINIPQTSSRSHPTQSSLPSDSSKSLNPNAPAFVPRSFGSKSNPLTMGGFPITKTTLSSSLNDKFVYTPSATNGKTTNGNDEDDGGFVYLGADSNTDNNVDVEEDDDKFVYTEQKETKIEEDDDETPFVYSSNNNDENADSVVKSPIQDLPEAFVYPSNEEKKVPGSPKVTPYVIGNNSSTGSDSDVSSGNAEIPVFTKVSESKAVENTGGVDTVHIKLNTDATD